MIWRIISQIVGILLVIFTLRDVFRDLFHPTRSGSLSDWIAKGAAFAKRLRPNLRATVGPLALVGVILAWVTLITLGFALIYLGSFPLVAQPGADPQSFGSRFLHSVYMSLGSLVTFKTFDVDPQTSWLRLVIACEGLIGFAVITASISWTVLLYPALARARWLAERIEVYEKASHRPGFGYQIDPAILLDFARSIIQVRIDLRLFPILLVFYPASQSASLASKLPLVVELAADGKKDSSPADLRRAAIQLEVALDRFAELIAENVIGEKSHGMKREELFKRFAEME